MNLIIFDNIMNFFLKINYSIVEDLINIVKKMKTDFRIITENVTFHDEYAYFKLEKKFKLFK